MGERATEIVGIPSHTDLVAPFDLKSTYGIRKRERQRDKCVSFIITPELHLNEYLPSQGRRR